MQTYINQHGCIYRVMERSGKFRARYQMPGQSTWLGSNHVRPRETADEAQKDLDRVAIVQGWKKTEPSTDRAEGMCCDCWRPERHSICGDFSENGKCKFRQSDGSCWM